MTKLEKSGLKISDKESWNFGLLEQIVLKDY